MRLQHGVSFHKGGSIGGYSVGGLIASTTWVIYYTTVHAVAA